MTMASAGAIRGEYSTNGGIWWHLGSRVALDLPYWAMRLASYRLIRMAIEMTSEGGAFVRRRRLFRLTNRSEIT